MVSNAFKYSAFTLDILAKIIGTKFTVEGVENIPQKPAMFVANHFTRFETFIIPYLLYQYSGRQVRCLADDSIYRGMLGKFLQKLGTISTSDINRDKIIVKDLISGDYDWMIYPEGSMIKSKEIERKEFFVNRTPHRDGPVRTGSAVLAMKAHLYRQDLIDAYKFSKYEVLHWFKQNLNLEYSDDLCNLDTHVVPLSVSYYPIRPGENKIEIFARKFAEKLSPRVVEELQIEGNLLMNAEINLHFGKPINLAQYIKSTRDLIYQIPIIKNDTKTNFVIKYFKHRLTTQFMEDIYSNLQINIDHIFSAALSHITEQEVTIDHLRRIIFVSAQLIRKSKKFRFNKNLLPKNLVHIFCDEKNNFFDNVFELAKKFGEIEELEGGVIKINKLFLQKKYDFHSIRIQNTLRVIYNEFALLEVANNIVKKVCKIEFDDLRQRVFQDLCALDREIYEQDYQIYFDREFSKDRAVGMPYFLQQKIKTSQKIRKIGILICHGYKSSPKEIENLAKFFNGFGFKVYAVRLKGHGTSPINMKDVTWQDWQDSLQLGYAILRNVCSKVILVGFSTGGLLSLVAASTKIRGLSAVVSINAALKLKDIRARMVPGINVWNDMLDKLHITHGKFEYVDDKPENPDFNYSRNYLKAVEQLEELMEKCATSLSQITTPALIIQALEDPVVDPSSGKIIYDSINSSKKMLFEPDFNNHVIINGARKEEVFAMIKQFLHKLNLV